MLFGAEAMNDTAGAVSGKGAEKYKLCTLSDYLLSLGGINWADILVMAQRRINKIMLLPTD